MSDEGDKGGRPSALTPEVRKKILDALRVGASRPAAAGLAGISARTLRDWMAKSDDVEPLASFRVAVEAAEATAQARLSGGIFKAALEDPKLAQWYLERRWPEEWARRTVETHDVKVAPPGWVSPEELERASSELERRLGLAAGRMVAEQEPPSDEQG